MQKEFQLSARTNLRGMRLFDSLRDHALYKHLDGKKKTVRAF
jgi:hypothetical protein